MKEIRLQIVPHIAFLDLDDVLWRFGGYDLASSETPLRAVALFESSLANITLRASSLWDNKFKEK